MELNDDFFKSRMKVSSNGCWEWSNYKNSKGYGTVKKKGKLYGAHRLSWAHFNKREIPEGLHVLHKCDNPSCINPEHLFIGTNQDNVDDRVSKNRNNHWVGKCPGDRGIEFTVVTEIRKAKGSVPAKILAEKYGVSIKTIYKYWNKSIRKHC
tara:strand:+ start:730 stop:1185 length:456 start_codon:yes stop_codon:yes gene_type:complete